MLKLAKEIFRFPKWTRSYSSIQEKRLSLDEMHKPFIRKKRSFNNLPDCWTNTRWIHRFGNCSWKKRSKVKHQWEKHKKTLTELDICEKNKAKKEQFLFLLKTKYKNSWYYFKFTENVRKKNYDFYSNEINYSIANELVNENILEGKFYLKTWEFIDFGEKKVFSKKILIAVKLK